MIMKINFTFCNVAIAFCSRRQQREIESYNTEIKSCVAVYICTSFSFGCVNGTCSTTIVVQTCMVLVCMYLLLMRYLHNAHVSRVDDQVSAGDRSI